MAATWKKIAFDADKAPLASPIFTGTVTIPALKVTTGAAAGNLLVSSADGTLSYLAAGATTKNRKTGNYSTTRDTKAEEIDRIVVGYDDKGEAQYLIIKPHP